MTEPQQALRVLVIDDDEVDVENIRRAFNEARADVELFTAFDGREGLDLLLAGSVPLEHLLILLDLNMPRMNGIEFLEQLRANLTLRHLPVVVLTTSDTERDVVNAYNFNVAGYLLKPMTLESFVEIVTTVEAYWRLQELP